MKRVVLVGAARPNFMKIAPVMRALEACGIEVILVHTGQHYDDSMSGAFFRDLQMREPDYQLAVGPGSHAVQTARVMERFEPVVVATEPDAVVVVGDVNSTLACALVASKLGVPVAHVEAGLRSGDWSMPEEANRVCTDVLSDWLLAPSPDACVNLAREGVDDRRVFLVGNVMVDSLLHHRALVDPGAVLAGMGLDAGYALLTLHRPSNVDSRETLEGILRAIDLIGRDRPIVFPVHPRTRGSLSRFGLIGALEASSRVHMIDPVSYLEMIALVDQAAVVLTDSGGLQEETTVLGVPCLTLRDNTERPITISEGTNRLVGTEAERILAAYNEVRLGRVEKRCPALWDGRAAVRIADVLLHATRESTRSGTPQTVAV